MTFLIAYAATLATFVTVDLVWLRLVMLPLFQSQIPELLAPRPDKLAAAIFYLAFCVGLTWFVVLPAAQAGSAWAAARDGALIGLMAYGTYELTNMATLRDWSWRLVAADMAWGAVLCALAAVVGTLAAMRV